MLCLLPMLCLQSGTTEAPPMLDIGGLSMLHVTYGAMGNSSAFQAALEVSWLRLQQFLCNCCLADGAGWLGVCSSLLRIYNDVQPPITHAC